MMDIWQKHAERERRRAQFERFNQWCLDHPIRAYLLSSGIALLIFSVARLLQAGLDALAPKVK